MKIVLLSGGSGKRLWPLSNKTRSKQFLKLLKAPDGTYESMVQRVARQISEAGLVADITLATNASQKDIIVNQLGDEVDMVCEPCRRDTFPAIALSASYLSKVKACGREEIVVVMPCDPFADDGYFQTIGKMVSAVEAGSADLVLMGIRPSYPSEKFGYVVPKTGAQAVEGAFPVSGFTEKPDVARAERLLAEGALWNGGVFAFRLGYMMDIVERYVKAESFEQTVERYCDFPKISFDYEVAEKAESVSVVPFDGNWKDLGTWNALSEELPSNTIGNAMLGPCNNNTYVVNETGLPVFVNGLKDVIVAASPDGILVCGKDHTEDIKKYVGELSHRPMYEERRWGAYKVLDDVEYSDGFRSLTKTIMLKKGRNISYQIHHHRSEIWTFVDGEGLLAVDGQVRRVCRGDVVDIRCGQLHSVKAVTDLTFIEVQLGNPLVEEDIERFAWDWEKYSE